MSVCVTGGLVRGLHPSELSTATRLRHALDSLGEGGAYARTPPTELHADLRGFRLLAGGLAESLTEALVLARADGTRAPLLLLVQGAPPLAKVLGQLARADNGHIEDRPATCLATEEATEGVALLQEIVIVLGDHIGLTEYDIELISKIGAEAGGGGPVVRASLAHGALLTSQCIVIANHYLDTLHDCPSQLWQPSAELKHRKRQRARRIQRKMDKRERMQLEVASMAALAAELGAESSAESGHTDEDDTSDSDDSESGNYSGPGAER